MNNNIFFYWNNQGCAHDGFHEMWILMVDGWHLFSNDNPEGAWLDNGLQPLEDLPDFENGEFTTP